MNKVNERPPKQRFKRFVIVAVVLSMASTTFQSSAGAQETVNDPPVVVDQQGVVDDDSSSPDKKTTKGKDLRNAPRGAAIDKSIREYLRGSARQGALMDRSEVASYIDELGTLVHVTGKKKIDVLSVEVVTGEVDGQQYEDRNISLTFEADEADAKLDEVEVALPQGVGSALTLRYMENQCYMGRASWDSSHDNYYNTIYWCWTKYRLDGGNGVKAYGSWDDDGSRWEDFYSYKRYATVQPNQRPLRDFFIREAHVFSWPTYNTRVSRRSRLMDWEPTGKNCAGDDRLTISTVTGVGVSLSCSSGTDISFTSSDGRFKHRYSCSVCGGGTRYVGFQIAVKVKQGTTPYWIDDNYASFRQNFTTNTGIIDN